MILRTWHTQPDTIVSEPMIRNVSITFDQKMREALATCSVDAQRLGLLVLLLAAHNPTDRDLVFLLGMDEGRLASARAEIAEAIRAWNAAIRL